MKFEHHHCKPRRFPAVVPELVGILSLMIVKYLILCLMMTAIFCGGCLPSPEGRGFYWVLSESAPIVIGGDGSSYEAAYRFKGGGARFVSDVETFVIHDKYWVAPQRAYEGFWRIVPPAKVSCADSINRSTVTRDGKIYDVVTFELPEGMRTLYFEVTKYRQKKGH